MEDNRAFVPSVGDDDSNVADIQGWRGNVENCGNGQCTSNADEIETAAEGDYKPDSIDRSVSILVHFAPKSTPC